MMNQQQNRPQLEPFTAEQVQRAIREGGRALVELAERVGRQARNQGLTTNQIRNIFGLVKRIEMEMRKGSDWQHELAMLKPKMAYAAARAKDKNKKDTGAETLARVLSLAIDEVGSDDSKFARFVDLFEAILAYHKAAGGR
jgi:CRISPR-associated protein Csm2